MNQIKVTDLRFEGDPSLAIVPRITNFEILQSIFRLQVDRSQGWDQTPLGKACWKLVGFELRAGPAEYKLRVLRENSQPFPSILVYRHRPGAPQLPGNVKPAYFTQGEGQFTNSLGEVVFGQASKVEANGGSDTIWVSASPPGQEPQSSDAVRNLGRHELSGLVPNPLFQFVVQEGSELPEVEGEYTLALVRGGQELGQLAFAQDSSAENCLLLRRGGLEVGRIPWQVVEPNG